jgi:SpoVK/Ycf46/Vps4 family AAA+-type ATPase
MIHEDVYSDSSISYTNRTNLHSFLDETSNLDNFNTKTLLIAATNHQHLLDNAIWRRFDEILYFDKPNKSKIKEVLKKKLRIFKTDINHKKLSKELVGMSYAQIERICKEAMRYCILNDISVLKDNILLQSISEEKRRKRIYDSLS